MKAEGAYPPAVKKTASLRYGCKSDKSPLNDAEGHPQLGNKQYVCQVG